MDGKALVAVDQIESIILHIRGQKVILSHDLAQLYGIETKILNKAVKRNLDRFPEDFMFRLTAEEAASLRFQIGTSKGERGGRRYLAYAFTEQGVAMLSGVLNSPTAVKVNIEIMRAFVRLRRILVAHRQYCQSLRNSREIYRGERHKSMDVPVATLQFEVKGGEATEINLGALVIIKAKGLGDATVAIAMMFPSSGLKWKRQGVSSFLF